MWTDDSRFSEGAHPYLLVPGILEDTEFYFLPIKLWLLAANLQLLPARVFFTVIGVLLSAYYHGRGCDVSLLFWFNAADQPMSLEGFTVKLCVFMGTGDH